mmetsp:Transcript_34733/g.103038  ORF Transcript_34733/g.103038 Transcript_34733/m.103038 type:complete len:256 (+) Transcript_34733:817-1584(+)
MRAASSSSALTRTSSASSASLAASASATSANFLSLARKAAALRPALRTARTYLSSSSPRWVSGISASSLAASGAALYAHRTRFHTSGSRSCAASYAASSLKSDGVRCSYARFQFDMVACGLPSRWSTALSVWNVPCGTDVALRSAASAAPDTPRSVSTTAPSAPDARPAAFSLAVRAAALPACSLRMRSISLVSAAIGSGAVPPPSSPPSSPPSAAAASSSSAGASAAASGSAALPSVAGALPSSPSTGSDGGGL